MLKIPKVKKKKKEEEERKRNVPFFTIFLGYRMIQFCTKKKKKNPLITHDMHVVEWLVRKIQPLVEKGTSLVKIPIKFIPINPQQKLDYYKF